MRGLSEVERWCSEMDSGGGLVCGTRAGAAGVIKDLNKANAVDVRAGAITGDNSGLCERFCSAPPLIGGWGRGLCGSCGLK